MIDRKMDEKRGLPIIEAEHLTHRYVMDEEDLYALENIDLKIYEGEFLAIVGTNGSGKSTLIKHMNGLLLPTSGSMKVFGMDTKDSLNIKKIRQKVGMVFQNPDNQIIASIVEDDVAFGPENLGVERKEIRRRVDESLAIVEMTDFKKFPPHLLSGGQKQRVAIAGALAMKTQCLVLDEPTAMLDPMGRKEVLATVKRINQEEHITIIFITHFMEETLAADRVLVMEKGKIIALDTPRRIFSDVKMMKKIGLDVPLAVDVAECLRGRGIQIKKDVLTSDELAVALCQLS